MSAMFAEEVPEGEFDAFSPANISPVVAYLAAENARSPARSSPFKAAPSPC